MRNTLIPILVAICLFITGVAILNIQLWYSAKAEYLAGARYAANNINHWICPYISRHLLSLNPLQARCRRYSRG
ncbi:hypothetical protein, partial [Escherichia coli]|uniref:hypothetical protein n=1 Tax=Escherichia coli TaxID=562 RepID=UPI001BFC31F5